MFFSLCLGMQESKPNIIPSHILPVIVLSQFAGTSLWFAGNAVLSDLQTYLHLEGNILGLITSSVQLGFISGTLIFAFFAISDLFSPRKIFLFCALSGALANLGIYFFATGLYSLLFLRFITGFFLAGIYPIGMKIAAGWYHKGLGKAIGFLVGALVLGTAFPHLLKSLGKTLPWQSVIWTVSGVAASGGILMYLSVKDGPYISKGATFDPKALFKMFGVKDFRAAAFGYFGHMWELYAFWAFVPWMIEFYLNKQGIVSNISLWAFIIIAIGAIGCTVGGIISQYVGSARVAFVQLTVSGLCCLFSPWIYSLSPVLFLAFLIIWGITVVGDSPQFSALTAQTAPKALVGSALTIVNCIGFSITIFSIQLISFLLLHLSPEYVFLILVIGPVFGLISLIRLLT